jgi:hypothetical protein
VTRQAVMVDLHKPPFEPVRNDVTPALWFKQPGNNNGGDDELFAP